MSAPDAGLAAVVTKPGNCDRFIGKDKDVIKHSWGLHSVSGKVRLATKHIDSRHRNRDYYLRGDGSEATAAARNEGRTPRIHMFTNGCGKQYKGRRNFRFLVDSVRQIGVFVDHHFAATSHFKGCHDGLGGFAKNAMRRRERFGHRNMGADGVISFLKSFFRERVGGEGEEGMRKYFATWSPYRMRKVHVELIGKMEIYRPNSILEGINGTREMYHFAGANTPKYDAQTTTKGLEDIEDIELVLKREGGGRLTEEEESRLAGLGEVKAIIHTGRWTGDEAGEPVSGEKVVDVRKVKQTYRIRTGLASCFCSVWQRSQYEDSHVNRAYPGIVPAMRDGQVRETVIMDTGVAPVDGSNTEEITFKSRQKTCQMARVTGTQLQ